MSTLKRKADSQAGSDAKKPKQNASIMSFFAAPKAAAKHGVDCVDATGSGSINGKPEAPATKFDKAAWVAGLTAEQKDLLKLEIQTLHESWLAHLKDEITSPEFLNLKRFLNRETTAGKKWFPPPGDVYSWSRHTPFHSVKVVILGQDPYHNDHQAHGLAFSVRMPTPAPPSLRNMYTCLQRDYPSFTPPPKPGGLLTPWADRGVLLLNTCLTVRAHEANSHANRGWERFTQRIIDTVAARRPRGVVFLAWGTPAGKRVQKVDRARHLVLTAVHPSPLSASRGFFTCRHFRKANEWLAERYGDEGEIDWALVPGNTTIERKSAGEGAKAKGGVVDEEGAVRTVKVVSKVVDVETHGEVMKKDADAGQAKAAIKVDEPCATDHGFEGNEKVAPKEAPSPERGDAKVETEEEGEKSAP